MATISVTLSLSSKVQISTLGRSLLHTHHHFSSSQNLKAQPFIVCEITCQTAFKYGAYIFKYRQNIRREFNVYVYSYAHVYTCVYVHTKEMRVGAKNVTTQMQRISTVLRCKHPDARIYHAD